MDDEIECESDRPVHDWFGLSYASYYTVPRAALQAMPLWWQQDFVALMKAFNETGIETPDYHVIRKGEPYSSVDLYDEDDELSSVEAVHCGRPDPWADYRHPDQSLLPEELRRK